MYMHTCSSDLAIVDFPYILSLSVANGVLNGQPDKALLRAQQEVVSVCVCVCAV